MIRLGAGLVLLGFLMVLIVVIRSRRVGFMRRFVVGVVVPLLLFLALIW